MKNSLAVILLLIAYPAIAAIQAPPNILILMAEDMSSRVSAFGDPVAVTPNIDSLAAAGVSYPNTFTTAGVCSPSRAAHILGIHQISTGSQHMRSSNRPQGGYFSRPAAEVKAYPELLRSAGYYTFTDQKLDYQFSGIHAGSGPFTIWNEEGTKTWAGRDEQQPFFGLINFQVTHETGVFSPLGTMPNSLIHFVVQLRRWWALGSIEYGVVKPESLQLEPYYPDTPTVRADIARHYDNIAHMDHQVGRILAQLETEGLADSTIVIWTTDHGDGLPRAKRELYDSGIKVPMIIRWPDAYRPQGIAAGEIDQRLISFIDLAPTVLAMANVTAPDYLQGQDFTSQQQSERRYIYASRDRIDEVADRQRAVRDAQFKYIRSWHPELPGGHLLKFRDNINMVTEMLSLHRDGQLNPAQDLWFNPPGKERLYDIDSDPFELQDLSEDPALAMELNRMRAELDRWLASAVDWSDMSETAMVNEFYPDGKRPKTLTPSTSFSNGILTVAQTTNGSSIGYRLDGGNWSVYKTPIDVSTASIVELKAIRYGWQESEIIELTISQTP